MNFNSLALGLTVVSMFAFAGCAADTGEDADAEVESSADELTKAGQALIGSYVDDSGAFKSLVLTSDKVGQRNKFHAHVDTGIRCFRAPCPSEADIEGTFTAGAKTITFYSTTAPGSAQHLLGQYTYLVQGQKFSLSRKDFAQSLARVDAAASIWPIDASTLVAQSGSGFAPPPPPGSNCALGQSKYSLEVSTRSFTWERCDFTSISLPFKKISGKRTLSASQYATVDAAMHGVTVAKTEMCGADKPFMTLKVTSPAGVKEYTDSFYSCQGSDRTYVDNIGGVFGAFSALAK